MSTVNSSYAYINDLMQLGTSGHGSSVDPRIMGISTPLKLDTWKTKLRGHPDQDFTAYTLRGIEHGFRIGIDSTRPLSSAKRNMQSAMNNPTPWLWMSTSSPKSQKGIYSAHSTQLPCRRFTRTDSG